MRATSLATLVVLTLAPAFASAEKKTVTTKELLGAWSGKMIIQLEKEQSFPIGMEFLADGKVVITTNNGSKSERVGWKITDDGRILFLKKEDNTPEVFLSKITLDAKTLTGQLNPAKPPKGETPAIRLELGRGKIAAAPAHVKVTKEQLTGTWEGKLSATFKNETHSERLKMTFAADGKATIVTTPEGKKEGKTENTTWELTADGRVKILDTKKNRKTDNSVHLVVTEVTATAIKGFMQPNSPLPEGSSIAVELTRVAK